jgi:tight adherence protein C
MGISWIVSLVCVFSGGILLTTGLRSWLQVHAVSQRFHQHVAAGPGSPRLGDAGRDMLERIGRRIAGHGQAGAMQQSLWQAGLFDSAAPFVFMALRLIASLAAAAGALLPAWLQHGAIDSKSAAIAFFFGFFVYRGCTVLLKLRIEARQRQMRREMPYMLDLTLMVLESGVSIDQALQHVSSQITRVAPVVGQLLARYVADTEDGMPYEMALDRLSSRLALTEGRDFTGLLKQNLLQGGELGKPLRQLATDIAEARLAQAREQVGRKSVLLTIAMLIFFMPVLVIALVGPAVSDLSGTLGNVAHNMTIARMKK